jgi:hypothetical protein
MAAGDVASIRGLGSGLRSDCEAGLPTETGSSGLIGAGAFDMLRRKVPSAWAGGKRCGPLWCDRTASHGDELRFPLGSLAVTYCDDAGIIAPPVINQLFAALTSYLPR